MPPIRRLSVLLGALAVAPASILAQNDQQPQPQTLLAFECATVSEALAHPKDEGLRRAIAMIPARLRELPNEIPDLGGAPPGVFDLIDLAFEGPCRLAVVSLGADPQTGMPRTCGEVALGSRTRAGAEAAHRAFADLVADVPQMQRATDGSLEVQTPTGVVSIGAYEGEDGRWWFGARLGDQVAVADSYAALPRPGEGRTLMHGSMDLASLIAPMKMMGAMLAGGNPEAAAGMAMVENLGILDALSRPMDSVVWRDGAGAHARTVIHNARESMTRMGVAGETLTAAQIGAIPADAMAASISRSDLSALLGVIEMLKSLGPEVRQGLDAFTEQTGVDLESDVIRSLNGVFAFYSSDSTGGSGLMSWVALAGVGDHDAMRGALGKLADAANGFAQGIPYGDSNGKYLRIARTSEGGIDFLTFQTPGIPVPFSPTIAITDQWLVVGASRQSALAAARQAAGRGDGGLLSSKAFRQQWPGSLDGAVQVHYLDTARAIGKGYGLTTLLGGALENGVRSALGADRDPGMIVPPHHDLVQGSRAMVEVIRWEGDDLVITAHMDGSAIVNVAGFAGVYAEPVMLFMVPGIVLPAIGQARQNAIELLEEEHEPGF